MFRKVSVLVVIILAIAVCELQADATSPLVGTWGNQALVHFNDGRWETESNRVTFNSDGTGVLIYKRNENGTLSSGTENFTYTTELNPDGTITIWYTAQGKTEVEPTKVVLSADEKVAIIDGTACATNREQVCQEFSVMVKIDTSKTYSNADLSGEYYTIAYGHSGPSEWPISLEAFSGIFNFNGYGSYTATETVNGDGTIFIDEYSETYLVNTDGSFVNRDIPGTSYLTGDGKVFINPNDESTDCWENYFGIKRQDRTYSTADLEGTWAVAGFGDENGTSFNAEFGFMTFQADGNYSYNFTNQRDGTFTTETGAGTFLVSADGSFGESVTPGAPYYAGAIGNDGNIVIFNMSFGKSSLYHREIFVGVRVSAEQILMWEQVNEDGFGDVHNIGTWPWVVFGDYVYVGTESYWETEGGESHSTGGQLWRGSEDNDWEQVNEDGFGNVNNSMIWPGTVFGGYLYVGAENNLGDEGGGIWRSQTGDPGSWEQVVTNGFGDATNAWVIPWVVFDGYLYAGTSKERTTEGSCEVWRSPDGITWQQVNTDGFGDANNSEEPIYMSVFGDYFYIGTYNSSTGGEIWRTKGLGGPPFTDWEQANTDGFGDPNNNTSLGTGVVFKDNLYVGTSNNTTGGQIWRSPDGTTWQQVNTSGFGNPNNSECFPSAALNGYLYAGTWNEQVGGQVWRSQDGTTWTKVSEDGLGDPNNIGIVPSVVFDDYLYVGTLNEATGGEVWITSGVRVEIDAWTKYWEDGSYQLGLEADAIAGDVESITVSGPSYLDTATVNNRPDDDPNQLYDDGQHYDDDANDGYWEVMLDLDKGATDATPPAVGDTITFEITYTDLSTETKQATINGVFNETATLISPADGATVDTLTPTFEWLNLSIPVEEYCVQISEMDYGRIYDVWDLPDGTTSYTIPSGYLNWETTYSWLVSAWEEDRGEALTMWDTFTTISQPP